MMGNVFQYDINQDQISALISKYDAVILSYITSPINYAY